MSNPTAVAVLASSLPTTVLPAVAIVVATSLLVHHMRKRQQQQVCDGIYHPLPPSERGWLPFVGVGLRFFQDVNLFLRQKQHQHGADKPFRVYLMGKWWSFVYALPDIKLVLNSKDSELSFLEGFSDLMSGMLPKKFTFIPRHHFFLPLFREANMQWFFDLLVHEAKGVVPTLLRQSSSSTRGGEIDLFESCRHVVMRLNLRVLFGPIMLQDGRYEQYYECFEAIDPEKGLVDLMSSLFLGAGKKERAWATITELTKEVLEAYQAKRSNSNFPPHPPPFESVLELLVQNAAQEKEELDLEEVVGDIFSFVFAAFTNSFAVLGWCIHELSGNAAAREQFLQEASHQQQTHASDNSIKQIEDLVVGKAILEEVIRLKTPGLFFRKVVAPQGVVLSTGHVVPRGDLLAFSARYINTLPAFYQDPLAFDPDRFLVRNEKKAAGIYALQWGGGRHPCLGASFATLEILLVLRELFTMCEVQRMTETVTMSKSQLGTSDKPLQPVYVRVVPKPTTATK